MSSKPPKYQKADTIGKALTVLDNNPNAEILAAGQSLMSPLNNKLTEPDTVVDISEINAMQGIKIDDDVAQIGALTSYTTVENADIFWEHAADLAEAVSKTADPQIRNRATLAGNIATPYPVSDLSASVITSDITVVVAGTDGERRINGKSLVTSSGAAAIGSDELIVRIEVPLTSSTSGGAYVNTTSPVSRHTLIGVAARVTIEDGAVSAARVAANGILDCSVRLTLVEDALVGQPLADRGVQRAASRAADHFEEEAIRDDSQASADYRVQLLKVITARALRQAIQRVDISD